MTMIETRGLRKACGKHVVLDGIDLHVDAGTICALLGPNGAGNMLAAPARSALEAPAERLVPPLRVARSQP